MDSALYSPTDSANCIGVETFSSNQYLLVCNVSLPCSIPRYSVIPLSQNSRLIGWVPHSDTLHTLIRDYRERKKIMLNVEHRLMLQVRGAGEDGE